MAEGGESCPCNQTKKKGGVSKLFRFMKKKKKTASHDQANCLQCLHKNTNLNAPQYTMDSCIEKERKMMLENTRKEPTYAEILPERKRLPIVEENTYDEIAEFGVQSPIPTDRGMVSPPLSSGLGTVAPTGSRVVEGSPAAEGVIDESLMKMPIKYHPPRCTCPPCKKKQYDDGLLAMDAQVILHNSLLSDAAGLFCVIL